MEENKETSRREFLRNTAATVAATVAAPAVAKSSVYSLAPGRVIGANDKINIAHVGLGVQGYGAHVRLLKEKAKDNNTEQVAICDLYSRRLRKAGTEIGISESGWYKDHRKM